MSRKIISRRVESEGEPTVNLTPLIDVVFVILIMFILVAPMLEIDQVELAESAPEQNSASAIAAESSPLSIHVHGNNAITFNNQQVTAEKLALLLREAKGRFPHVRPQVFHDRKAFFGTYQSVKNAVEMAGFEQMDIVLLPASVR